MQVATQMDKLAFLVFPSYGPQLEDNDMNKNIHDYLIKMKLLHTELKSRYEHISTLKTSLADRGFIMEVLDGYVTTADMKKAVRTRLTQVAPPKVLLLMFCGHGIIRPKGDTSHAAMAFSGRTFAAEDEMNAWLGSYNGTLVQVFATCYAGEGDLLAFNDVAPLHTRPVALDTQHSSKKKINMYSCSNAEAYKACDLPALFDAFIW